MGDFARCRECKSIFEKTEMNKLLGRYTKGIAGKEKYCSEECRLNAEYKASNGKLLSKK